MRFLLLTLVSLVLTSSWAQAYEMQVVQAVSSSKRSFVTRNGKRHGIQAQMTASFVSDDVAVIAKALTVTSEFTQWELVNQEGTVPFEVGDIITYHPAQEYLWSLNPSEARRRYVEEVRSPVRQSWITKVASTRGLTESTSEAAATSASRGGVAVDALYERQWTRHFAWDGGIRYERETLNLAGGSLTTQRLMAIADLLYYFEPLEFFYESRFFISVGAGWGQSSTQADGIIQSGNAFLLPSAKLGVCLPFNKQWDFIAEGAFETLRVRERLEGNVEQNTTQSNLRLGLGLRRFF